MPQIANRERSIIGSPGDVLENMDAGSQQRSLSAPAIPDSCGEEHPAAIPAKHLRHQGETQTSTLSISKRSCHDSEVIKDSRKSGSQSHRGKDNKCDNSQAVDAVTCDGIEDSGVFDTEDTPSVEIGDTHDPRVDEYRAFRDSRYCTDSQGSPGNPGNPGCCGERAPTMPLLSPGTAARVNRAFEGDLSGGGLPRVEVEGPTPIAEKPLQFVQAPSSARCASSSSEHLDFNHHHHRTGANFNLMPVTSSSSSSGHHRNAEESCTDEVTSSQSGSGDDDDEEEEGGCSSRFTRIGSLKVPLDIKKYYGTHYNSHILLVDEVSFPTEMQKRENSELLESEVLSFQSPARSKLESRGSGRSGRREEEDEEVFKLDMLPTLPTPEEQDPRAGGGANVGKAGDINRGTRFVFPPTSSSSSPREYKSLPRYHGDKKALSDQQPPKPNDHLIFTLLVMFCCNPVVGIAAFIMSLATNIYYEKGDYEKSFKFSRLAKLLSLIAIATGVITAVILTAVLWPRG